MDSATISQNQSAGLFSDLLTQIKQPITTTKQPVFNPWTEQDDNDLRHHVESGKKRRDVAELLDRTPDAVTARAKKLGLSFKARLTDEQRDYIALNYPLYGSTVVANHLGISKNKVSYEAKLQGLTYKPRDAYNPPIPKSLLPYHMVKRVSLLNRDCPTSQNKVDDCVIVLYDKTAPSAPMMAMHLDDMLAALEQHFGRRTGVVTGALLSGYKA